MPMPDGGPVTVTGTVVEMLDGGTAVPLAGAMVSAEYGGLYVPYCDLSRGSPYYAFGAITDADGNFTMNARQGVLGFHVFATGYYYTRRPLDTRSGTSAMLPMVPLTQPERAPVVVSAGFDKTTVAPGGTLTFSATVMAPIADDPLSDEIILIEPSSSWAVELDPPARGKPDDFPDGVWTKTFAAPTTPGTYTYHFGTTTAYCEASPVQSFQITVQ
jgi:hypothetical protein